MKNFLEEFKKFALRGNVMDLAIGVLIGGAFSGLVGSLTTNIISPIIGLFGGANFDIYQLAINGVEIKYGAFLTSIINFLIMTFVVFILVKCMRAFENLGSKEKPQAESLSVEPTTKKCLFCCSEISIEATRCPHCTSQL